MPSSNAVFKDEAHEWEEEELPSLRAKLDTNPDSSVKNKEKKWGWPRAVPDAVKEGVTEERSRQMNDELPSAPLMDAHFRVASTPKEIGQRLAEARKAAKMSRQEVADKTNSHVEAVGRLERGQTNPTFDTVMNYARVVGLPAGWAFGEQNPT